jgi:putative tryptophan/tyrosine transport system substrate-binding protein
MASHIGRRKFLATLGGAAAAWPLGARAQQPAMPVIGFLGTASLEKWGGGVLRWFQRGLAETGYVEGRNVTIEYRWADEQYDRLPALAAELVRQRVAVIAAPGLVMSASAAKAATTSIPIVFMIGSDPIELGLVASLNRPGGNLTGVAYLNAEVGAKRLELLRELLPAAKSIALLVNPGNPIETAAQARDLQVAGRALGVRVPIVNASNPLEIEEAFGTLVRERTDALQIGIDPLFGSHRHQIIALAARHKVPTIYPWRVFTTDGGLMNYGSSIIDAFRQVGVYTGQILKGAKPADLPVQRPTKLGFVLNLKTAKALGLTVPPSLLALADEVIE